MVTTVTKTIGSTGDYSTLQSWEDACPANLVTSDQIWQGKAQNQEFSIAGACLSIAGQTTDSTRYVELTTAAGASFADNANKLTNALRYNSSNGAGIRTTGFYVTAVAVTTDYTRISKLQITADYAESNALSVTASNCILDGLIVQAKNNDAGSGTVVLASGGVARNCLAITNTSSTYASAFKAYSGTVSFYNCSAINPSDVSGASGMAFQTTYSTIVITNCAGFGYGAFYGVYGGGSSVSGSNNASTSTISFGSSNQASLTYSSQIEVTTASTLDCRTKSGGALLANGSDTSGNGVTTDIVGTSRSGTYDIGVWEYAASGVTVSLTGIASTFSAGTLVASRSLPLTGGAITSTAGTVTPAHTSPLTGSAGTFSGGTLGVAHTSALTGGSGTFSAGTVSADHGIAITGGSGTFGSGTVGNSRGLPLSGSALTAAAGTLAIGISLALSGLAITSGTGTVSIGSSVAVALTGIAMTAAAGTMAPNIGVSISGSSATLSAGSVAYSATFALTGIASTPAGGTVGASGGDVNTVKALTGIQMQALPGNVKVTGGTRWVPQEARAITLPTLVGNTLPPPPRLTGDPKVDTQAQGQWLATLYDQLVKVKNVLGRIDDHETRIAAIEASNDN